MTVFVVDCRYDLSVLTEKYMKSTLRVCRGAVMQLLARWTLCLIVGPCHRVISLHKKKMLNIVSLYQTV